MHSCNNCNKSFKNMSKLMEHKGRRTPCRPPTHNCDRCNKGFASYQTLWKHKHRCKEQAVQWLDKPTINHLVKANNSVIEQKIAQLPTFNRLLSGGGVNERYKDTKIKSLVNAIIDGSSENPRFISKSIPLSPNSPALTMEVDIPKVPKKEKKPVVRQSALTVPTVVGVHPRTKFDIVDNKESENEDEDSDMEVEDDINMKGEEGKAYILPETTEGIGDRFNELYVEFMRQKKHKHRDELVFLLDEMLHRGILTPTEYMQLNTSLTEAADLKTDKEEKEEEEEEDEDDEEQNMMNSAVQYLIQHDKDELMELLDEIKNEINEELLDIVLEIEKLLVVFVVEEYLDGKPIRPQIDELLKKIEPSKISKSKQLRIKMLLDDIAKNRYRVQQIIQRLMDAEDKDEMLTILQMLVREGLLSDEQFKQLAELEDPDLNTIKEVITNTKIGQGLKFLPRTISNLRHTLQILLEELKENASALIKTKITSILEELFRRKAIWLGEYINLKGIL